MIFGWRGEEQPELNPYEIMFEQILGKNFSLLETVDYVNYVNVNSPNMEQIFISLEANKRPTECKLSAMDLFLGNKLRRGECIKSNLFMHFGLPILSNQMVVETAAITKRESLERNINAGMGKFFPDLRYEAEDVAGTVASLQTGD